jgi:hypothetical protein
VSFLLPTLGLGAENVNFIIAAVRRTIWTIFFVFAIFFDSTLRHVQESVASMDRTRSTACIEAAYRSMWNELCAEKTPD